MSQNLSEPIAVIGLASWYPGAPDAKTLWENILARRQQFRTIPDCRLPSNVYYSSSTKDVDKHNLTQAAFIDGFKVSSTELKIPPKTVDNTDITQWLALEIARKVLICFSYCT